MAQINRQSTKKKCVQRNECICIHLMRKLPSAAMWDSFECVVRLSVRAHSLTHSSLICLFVICCLLNEPNVYDSIYNTLKYINIRIKYWIWSLSVGCAFAIIWTFTLFLHFSSSSGLQYEKNNMWNAISKQWLWKCDVLVHMWLSMRLLSRLSVEMYNDISYVYFRHWSHSQQYTYIRQKRWKKCLRNMKFKDTHNITEKKTSERERERNLRTAEKKETNRKEMKNDLTLMFAFSSFFLTIEHGIGVVYTDTNTSGIIRFRFTWIWFCGV